MVVIAMGHDMIHDLCVRFVLEEVSHGALSNASLTYCHDALTCVAPSISSSAFVRCHLDLGASSWLTVIVAPASGGEVSLTPTMDLASALTAGVRLEPEENGRLGGFWVQMIQDSRLKDASKQDEDTSSIDMSATQPIPWRQEEIRTFEAKLPDGMLPDASERTYQTELPIVLGVWRQEEKRTYETMVAETDVPEQAAERGGVPRRSVPRLLFYGAPTRQQLELGGDGPLGSHSNENRALWSLRSFF